MVLRARTATPPPKPRRRWQQPKPPLVTPDPPEPPPRTARELRAALSPERARTIGTGNSLLAWLDADMINVIIRQGGALSEDVSHMANLVELLDWNLWELMNSEATDWIDAMIEKEMEAAATFLIHEMVARMAHRLVASLCRGERAVRELWSDVEIEMGERMELVREWHATGVVEEVLARPAVLARLLGFKGRPLKRVVPEALDDRQLRQAEFPLLADELGPPLLHKRSSIAPVRFVPGAVGGGAVSQPVLSHYLEARRFVVACMNLTGFAVATEERYGITSAMLRVVLGID